MLNTGVNDLNSMLDLIVSYVISVTFDKFCNVIVRDEAKYQETFIISSQHQQRNVPR